jgi:hypothetical protein
MFGSSLPPNVLGGLVPYLRYLCLFQYNGAQRIVLGFWGFFSSCVAVSLDCPFLIAPSVFYNVYILQQ